MKNQKIVKLGLALILLSFGGKRASGTELVSSNFDDKTYPGWVASTTAGSPPTILSTVAGNFETTGTSGRYVLQLDDSAASGGTSYATLSKAFTPQTNGSLDISFKIRFLDTGTTQKGDWRLALVGTTGSIYLRMKVSGSGAGFSRYSGTSNIYVPSTITSISTGQWYDVRIAANLKDKTYGWTAKNLSDDNANQIGGSGSTPIPFYQSGTTNFTASALAIVSVQRGGTFQIDDVRVAGFRNNLAQHTSTQNTSYQYSSTRPNYPWCTDTTGTQLISGTKRAPGFISPALWTGTNGACAGWVNTPVPITIQVDLGFPPKPISGVAMNMCAGTSSGAAWPAHVLTFSSTDGSNWYYLSDLVYSGESANNILSDGGWRDPGTRVYKFSSDVQSHGRYVCFSVIPSSGYVFIDQVEVYEGDHSLVDVPYSGTSISGIVSYSQDYRIKGGVLKRIKLDENELTKRIETASILDPVKANLKAGLLSAANAARAASLPPANSFEARIPFPSNDGHAAMYGIQGQLWTAQGLTQPVIWRTHKFQWLEVFNTPPNSSDTTTLSTSVLKGEVRGEALLISNPTGTPIQVRVNVENSAGTSDWLKIFQGAWTDTFERVVLSSALEEVKRGDDGTYPITVPAGMTVRLWLQVDAHELLDGLYPGNIRFQIPGFQTVLVSWNLRVSAMTLSPARLTTSMWDYQNGNGHYGINPTNRSQVYGLMKSHFVNSVWATSGVLPVCTAANFDTNNKLTGTLDYTMLDNWMVNECPGATRYFVYLGILGTGTGVTSGTTFGGADMGTPAFTARIGAWAHDIANHVSNLGIAPSKLTVLPLDEPSTVGKFQLTTQWLQAIKTGDCRLGRFVDPKIDGSTPSSIYSDAIALSTIVSPYTYTYAAAAYSAPGRALRQYYQNQITPQRELFFYLSACPVKLFDPTYYYRLHPWYIYCEGGSGMGYWSINDLGGTPSSWNEYVATRDSYSPLYISGTSATTSVHFEALREGIEDNELFHEVDEAVSAKSLNGTGDQSLQDGLSALKTRIDAQVGASGTIPQWPQTFSNTARWPQNLDPDSSNSADSPDKIRNEAIKLLENSNGLFTP